MPSSRWSRDARATGLLLLTSRRLLFAPAHADRETSTGVPLSQIPAGAIGDSEFQIRE